MSGAHQRSENERELHPSIKQQEMKRYSHWPSLISLTDCKIVPMIINSDFACNILKGLSKPVRPIVY